MMKHSVGFLLLFLPTGASFAGVQSTPRQTSRFLGRPTSIVRLHLQSPEAATVTGFDQSDETRQNEFNGNKKRSKRPARRNWNKSDGKFGRTKNKLLSPRLYQVFDPADRDTEAREAALHRIPHAKVLTSILRSWSKSRLTDAPQRCYEIRHLRTHHANDELAPNVFIYSVVMDAFARRRQPARAEAVLGEMTELSGLRPTTINLGCVLNAWCKSKDDKNAPDKCLRLLELMKQVSKESDGVPLSTIPYNIVIDAYASRGRVEEAEAILNELLTSDGDAPIPDQVSFNCVMKAWWKSGSRDAPEHCQRLLAKMMQLSEHDEQLRPDVITINTVLACLASRGRAREAEDLLRLMLEGDTVAPAPNVYSFSSVMQAWVKSDAEDAPDRCRGLLMELVDLAGKDSDLEPDLVTFNSVFGAFANQGRAKETEELLQFMMSTGRAPDRRSFNCVMNAWAKSSSAHGPEQCKLWLEQVQQLARRTDTEDRLAPDVFAYNTVIDAHAQRGQGPEAELALREMCQAGIQPDIVSFNSVINGWAKSDRDDAPDQCKRVLSEMYK